MKKYGRVGTSPQREREDAAKNSMIERVKDFGPKLYRIVKREAIYENMFVPCVSQDQQGVIRAFRLEKGKTGTFLDILKRAEYDILKEIEPDYQKRPVPVLKRSVKTVYKVFDRLDNNKLKLVEFNKTVHEELMRLRSLRSTLNPSILEYGPYHLYDTTITKSKTTDKYGAAWSVLPKHSEESYEKIPIQALDEGYPTLGMLYNYLKANSEETKNTKKPPYGFY